jgi:hypothetical protein
MIEGFPANGQEESVYIMPERMKDLRGRLLYLSDTESCSGIPKP